GVALLSLPEAHQQTARAAALAGRGNDRRGLAAPGGHELEVAERALEPRGHVRDPFADEDAIALAFARERFELLDEALERDLLDVLGEALKACIGHQRIVLGRI